MARCLQKFLLQAYTTVSSCQEKKGSVRTKRIEALYTKSGGASVCQGLMGRGSDGKMTRGGDWKMTRGERGRLEDDQRGRLKDGDRGRLEEEERGRVRWGDGEIGRISISPFFFLPSSFFLTSVTSVTSVTESVAELPSD